MPMLDAYIPAEALSADAARMLSNLTDILLRNEGADPTNPAVRSITWVFLHRPTTVYVAGEPAAAPRYRIVASVPEGQFDEERRQAMVQEVTEAVLDWARAPTNATRCACGYSQPKFRRHLGRGRTHQHARRHRRLCARRPRQGTRVRREATRPATRRRARQLITRRRSTQRPCRGSTWALAGCA